MHLAPGSDVPARRRVGAPRAPRSARLVDGRKAVAVGTWRIVRRRERAPKLWPDGGRFGLPADFLVGRDGRVVAAKYGEHAYDQWTVDELLSLAAQAPTPSERH